MSDIFRYMKEIYTKAKNNDLLWKPVYSNNMPCNGKNGIFTEMNFKSFFFKGHYRYVKFTVQYVSRCDENGLSHPEEGTKYYVLHELVLDDMKEPFYIPEPNNESKWNDEKAYKVNEYGRFRYVFDDEETAKKVVFNELTFMIYPLGYLLDDDEIEEWNDFIEKMR